MAERVGRFDVGEVGQGLAGPIERFLGQAVRAPGSSASTDSQLGSSSSPARMVGRFAETLRHRGVVGAAAAFADRRHRRVGSADTVPDDRVLSERHQQHRRRDLLALESRGRPLPSQRS